MLHQIKVKVFNMLNCWTLRKPFNPRRPVYSTLWGMWFTLFHSTSAKSSWVEYDLSPLAPMRWKKKKKSQRNISSNKTLDQKTMKTLSIQWQRASWCTWICDSRCRFLITLRLYFNILRKYLIIYIKSLLWNTKPLFYESIMVLRY